MAGNQVGNKSRGENWRKRYGTCDAVAIRFEIDEVLTDRKVRVLLFHIVCLLIRHFKLVCQFKK